MAKKNTLIYGLPKMISAVSLSAILSGCLTAPQNVTPNNVRQEIIVRGKGAPNCGNGDIVKITTRDHRPHYFQVCKLTPDIIEDCPSNGVFAPDKPEQIAIKDIVTIERRGRDTMPCFPGGPIRFGY